MNFMCGAKLFRSFFRSLFLFQQDIPEKIKIQRTSSTALQHASANHTLSVDVRRVSVTHPDLFEEPVSSLPSPLTSPSMIRVAR